MKKLLDICYGILYNYVIFHSQDRGLKLDARVVKTQEKLNVTFRQMLGEIPFEDITVNEICKRSGIRRATFYKHFSDKYEFLKFFVGSLREEFDKTIWRGKKPDGTFAYYVAYLRAIIKFLLRNEEIVKRILESEVMATVIEIIKEQNYQDTKDRIYKSVEEGVKLPASPDTVAMMMTGAVTHAVVTWFKNGMPIPAEDFINEVASVIKALEVKAV